MAGTSTKADLVIFDDLVRTGYIEVVEQYAEDINRNTNGGINLLSESMLGDFERASFWDAATLIRDRDPLSTAPVDSQGMSQSEIKTAKFNLGVGPVEATEDGFRKIGSTPEMMSLVLGQQFGKEVAVEWLNRGLTAGVACLTKTPATHLDISGEQDEEDAIISPVALNRVLGKMGDRRGRVVAWVMHSEAYTQLTEGYIVDKLEGVTDVVLMGGASPSLGLNVLISDSPALKDEAEGTFTILGVTQNGIVISENEQRAFGIDRVFGKENLTRIFQGELSGDVKVRGFTWSGSASPNLAAMANPANYSYVYADVKSGAGVALTVKDKYSAVN